MSDRPNQRLPEDKSGIDQPHDVLAAEEFAIPGGGAGDSGRSGLDPRTFLPSLLLVATIVLLVRRHRQG